jgi:hypothetical protein
MTVAKLKGWNPAKGPTRHGETTIADVDERMAALEAAG